MRVYRVCFRFLLLLLVVGCWFFVTSFSNSIQLYLCHSLVRSVRWRAFPHPDCPAFDGIITPLHEGRGEGEEETLHIMLLHIANLHRFF